MSSSTADMEPKPDGIHRQGVLARLGKDKLFGVALFAAPLFFLALYFPDRPGIDLTWPFNSPLHFMLIAFAYPVLEEFVFRGWLQGELWKSELRRYCIGPVSGPNLIASLVFVGFHFYLHAPLWALSVLVPSLIFGYFRDRYRNVAPAIFLHVFYNGGYFWLFGV